MVEIDPVSFMMRTGRGSNWDSAFIFVHYTNPGLDWHSRGCQIQVSGMNDCQETACWISWNCFSYTTSMWTVHFSSNLIGFILQFDLPKDIRSRVKKISTFRNLSQKVCLYVLMWKRFFLLCFVSVWEIICHNVVFKFTWMFDFVDGSCTFCEDIQLWCRRALWDFWYCGSASSCETLVSCLWWCAWSLGKWEGSVGTGEASTLRLVVSSLSVCVWVCV